ncbi:hypothetical protein [Streptomyces doebereineriae]|uniref:Uncharacterized protein n=1 Tax=Streptomyces doebereineriae TaxID=3075528 RepID=A0ABU2VDF2_9ACTN|nr:hypothetical protein [Streptomyces sp. DSM 41640]MDT0483592.1 hypothetical protein [Streptomyces sp. DSM 41640]
MTRSEIRDGGLLLFVAVLEASLILGSKLPTAWVIGVTALYLAVLLTYVRALMRRQRS